MVSYWIKVVGNTFENSYWLKKIDLVFMTTIVLKISSGGVGSEATRTREAFNATIKEVCETFGREK